ncbi:hypothetical protein ACFPRL_12325 [Pseudoclavibacter helvolus]
MQVRCSRRRRSRSRPAHPRRTSPGSRPCAPPSRASTRPRATLPAGNPARRRSTTTASVTPHPPWTRGGRRCRGRPI